MVVGSHSNLTLEPVQELFSESMREGQSGEAPDTPIYLIHEIDFRRVLT